VSDSRGGFPWISLVLASTWLTFVETVMVYMSGAVSGGVIGNAAYDALKLGTGWLKHRLSFGSEEEQRPYVEHVAHLIVASRLDATTKINVASCKVVDGEWLAVVSAGDSTYRVRIPKSDPSEIGLSIDLN
jgi:pyruvoyl-dependent arginine decarboxylase (PvlArgDC)